MPLLAHPTCHAHRRSNRIARVLELLAPFMDDHTIVQGQGGGNLLIELAKGTKVPEEIVEQLHECEAFNQTVPHAWEIFL